MANPRALVVLLLCFATLGLGWWLLAGGALDRPDPLAPAAGSADAAAPDAASAAAAAPPAAPAEAAGGAATTDAALRTAVLDDPGAAAEPALTGRVVDERGEGIADARVACIDGFGFVSNPMDAAFDFDGFDGELDPDAMAARARQQLATQVETRTDATGRFRIVPPGTRAKVGMRVQARGFQIADRTVQRPRERATDLGDVELKAGAIVTGRVVDDSGNGIAGARVARRQPFEAQLGGELEIDAGATDDVRTLQNGDLAVTDGAGRFELQHVPPGDVALRARHPEHPTATAEHLTVEPGRTLADVVITMPRGATITGRVLDVPEGAGELHVLAASRRAGNAEGPLGMMAFGVDMLEESGFPFGERDVTLGADGSFALRGLHAGRTYRLHVVQVGRGFAGRASCSAIVEAPAGSAGVTLRYEAGVTVSFTVVDAQSGAPIERLWVAHRLRGGGGFMDMVDLAFAPSRLRDYPDGRVTIANVRPKPQQTLTLTVDALAHRRLERANVALPAQGTLDLGTLRLEPQPVVHVHVVTADGGRPVAGATVELREADDSGPEIELPQLAALRGSGPHVGRTDGDGDCVLNSMPGQQVELRVTDAAHAPFASQPFALPATGDHRREVTLLRGGEVQVTVLGRGGEPAAGVVVAGAPRGTAGSSQQRTTDAEGTCRFERLAPGEHRFRIAEKRGGGAMAVAFAAARGDREDRPGWHTVTVVDGERAELRLEQDPQAVVHGIVRVNGVPLAGARVTFVTGGASGRDALQEQVMSEIAGQLGGGGNRSARTGEDGAYRIEGLPPGEHRLRVAHRDRAMPFEVPVAMREGDNVADVLLDEAVVRGVVRGPDGAPVEGATVRARQQPRGERNELAAVGEAMEGMMPGMGIGSAGHNAVKTDASGAFELRGVATDVALQLSVTAKGFAPATSDAFEVAPGATRDGVVVAVGAAGRVKVTVQQASGFAAVHAQWTGGGDAPPPVMRILQGKSAILDGLRPGPWRIEYHGMGGAEDERKRDVTVVAGETATVEF